MVLTHVMKLGALLVASLTFPIVGKVNKRGPVATRIAQIASRNTVFRDRFIIPLAQLFNNAEIKIQLYSMGIKNVTKVPKLPTKIAIQKVGRH